MPIIVFFTSLLLTFSSAIWGQEKFQPEVQIHFGKTGIHTHYFSQKQPQYNHGHIGYDLKVNYQLRPKLYPFLGLNGYKIFSADKDIRSYYFQLAVGLTYLFDVFKKSSFELSRAEEKIMADLPSQDQFQLYKEHIYRLKISGEHSFLKIKESSFCILAGMGINFQGEKKIFKINRGEIFSIGIGHRLPEGKNSFSYTMVDLVFEHETFRAADFSQNRYTGLLRLGKKF